MNKPFLGVLIGAVLSAPLLATAEQGKHGYPSGLSFSVVTPQPSSATERALQQQRHAPAPQRSEISAQMYVDTQRRISETFSRSIPDNFQSQSGTQQSR